MDRSFQIRGKIIFSKGMSELLKNLKKSLSSQKETILVFTPNPEQIMLAESSQEFNDYLLQADILVPDGVGLTYAARILGKDDNEQNIERIPGRLLAEEVIKLAEQQNKKILVIGGRDYSTTGKITVSGVEMNWSSAYVDVNNPTEGEEVALRERIEAVKPDIVFVAFGAPAQEEWLVRNREYLSEQGVKIGMVVGGTFDYLLGIVPSPPSWVSKIGLEWLFRLVTQPWRVKRQLKLISFIWLVLEEKWQSI